MSSFSGSCHCGAVRFLVEVQAVEMTRCDCSLCVKKNAMMIRVPEANLRLTAGEDRLSTYRWNTGVARHHFCSACGIYVFHRKRVDPTSFGVNVFCLEGFDATALPVRHTDGRGMSVEHAS